MTNYFNPFEKRTFSERFKAVFTFFKQNFIQVMKFYLLLFAAISALVSWYEIVSPDSSLNNLGDLISFIALAYFTHYIANRGDVRMVPFKEMLWSMGRALCKMIEASIHLLGFVLLFALVVVVFLVGLLFFLGKDAGVWTYLIACIPLFVFIIYILPIFSIYYFHFYFSSNLKDSSGALKESFLMVKGHWWSTFGFTCLFELLQLVIILPVAFILQEKATFVSGWIVNLLLFILSFFCVNTAILYQYGHLKTLREEQGEEKEKEKIVTAKGVVVAVVILLLSLLGAFNTERIGSALLNFAAMSGNPGIQNEVGRKCLKGKNYEEAYDWFMKAAEGGNASAQYNLGLCYRNGWGVAPDSLESFNWFMKSAEGGNASAQYKLGLCYLDGSGVPQDSLESFNWINKAAAQEHVDALNQLAYCYAQGIGTDVDLSMAHATIDKAIQIDPDDANLYDSKGEFYMMVGDREKAQEMYEKVIEKNPSFYKEFTWSRLYQYINNVPE